MTTGAAVTPGFIDHVTAGIFPLNPRRSRIVVLGFMGINNAAARQSVDPLADVSAPDTSDASHAPSDLRT
jgi:hypothetical protein